MANKAALTVCYDLGEDLTLIPVIKRAIIILGLSAVQKLIAEAKREYGEHIVEPGRLRTVGGIFLKKLKQDEYKQFIFKGRKKAETKTI